MSEVLYRKYRAKNFEEMYGQSSLISTLKYSILNGNFSHAYLFTGPRGTGKTSTARIFARAVNCLNNKDGSPCNECEACLSIISGSSLDVIEIDAASNRGIEEIRDLKQKVSFAPTKLKYKIYIIDEVHMLTKEAFNALLKTLEEPPSHVIFIMATTEVQKVPLTILSRTQRYDFKLAPKDEVIKKIDKIIKNEKVKLSKEAIELVATLGNGSFRDTETLLEKVISSLEKTKEEVSIKKVEEILGLTSSELIQEYIKGILERNLSAFEILAKLADSGLNITYFINQVLEALRIRMLDNIARGDKQYNLSQIINSITNLLDALTIIKSSPIEILPLEIATSKIIGDSSQEIGVNSQIPSSNSQNLTKPERSQTKPITQDAIAVSKAINPINKEEKKTASPVVPFDASEIEKWRALVAAVRSTTPNLAAFLEKAKLISINGSESVIAVGYKFHKDRIENNKNAGILSNLAKSIWGKELHFKAEVRSDMKAEDVGAEIKIESNEDIVEEIFKES